MDPIIIGLIFLLSLFLIADDIVSDHGGLTLFRSRPIQDIFPLVFIDLEIIDLDRLECTECLSWIDRSTREGGWLFSLCKEICSGNSDSSDSSRACDWCQGGSCTLLCTLSCTGCCTLARTIYLDHLVHLRRGFPSCSSIEEK